MSHRFTNKLRELRDDPRCNGDNAEYFLDILRNVEQDGVSIVHVGGETAALSWSYSVGLYDTHGKPEILISGFPSKLAASVINSIEQRYEQGEQPGPDDRWSDLLGGNVDCTFRPVEKSWRDQLMLSTCWFYGDVPFPALQCICPDFENKFPWDDGFDSRWRSMQALFFEGAEVTEIEKTLRQDRQKSKDIQ